MILNECQANVDENEKLEICNFDEIENFLCDFEKILHSEEIEGNENSDVSKLDSPNEIILNMIPLLEYYVVKSMTIAYNDNEIFSETPINLEYFENVSTLNCSIMETVKLLDRKEYKKFQKLWNFIISSITASSDVKDFEKFLNNFSISSYKNLSTFIRSIYNSIQKYNLRNLSLRSNLCNELKNYKRSEFKSDNDYNGSSLINSLVSILYQNDGQLKQISLNDINLWRKTIIRVQDIIWNNSHITGTKFLKGKLDLHCSINLSSKLLLEVKYVQELEKNVDDEYFASYKIGFNKLIEKLEIENHKITKMATNLDFEKTDFSTNMNHWEITYQSSMLHTLIGAIELCILNYAPIVDPVEKNQLKTDYVQQDLKYLKKLKTIYDFMRITMNYKNFGYEIYNEICDKINYIENRAKKCQHKVALRPLNYEDSNLFGNLMQEVQHFCKVNCEPNTLMGLITSAEKFLQYGSKINDNFVLDVNEMENITIQMTDVIRKINLWISNSQKFLHFTLDKYRVFYNDFVKPMECSCIMLQYGLENLKHSLIQIKNSYYTVQNDQTRNFHENDKLNSIIKNIGQFPSVYELQIFSKSSQTSILENTLITTLNGVDECETLYFQLIKTKLIEIRKRLNIFNELNSQIFYEFDSILNVCNKIWQNEEENRRKCLAEKESLYTYKTRCETENDDEIELREICERFPTYVKEDFGEFITEDNLEKFVKTSNNNNKDKKQKSNHMNLTKEDDYKFFGKNFIEIVENFSSCYYYNPKKVENIFENNHNLLEIFMLKSSAFIKLFNKYKYCINDECLDETMYNTFLLAVGLQQRILTKDSTLDSNSQSYNFYKDANVKEIIFITEIMDKLEERVLKQLDLYPDHAILNDIICIITRIRKFSFTSPITRFNTGFQLLRQKVSQWNEFAHKLNHLKDLECQIAECVQRWTKLELQCWRNCLSQTYEKVELNAYKYWFFIYNLLYEFIYENNVDSTYIDFKIAEKKFEDENYYDNNSNTTITLTNIKTQDIINVIHQFIESSNYADFNVRMKLIKSFELYLHNIELRDNSKKEILIAILHNIRIYFEQFSQEIEITNKSIRLPIEKKLRDFVKIESYNKDLSYFSMRSNVAKAHRNLNKFLKEYENLLKEKIVKVFQKKDNLDNECLVLSADIDEHLKKEMKINYYIIDIKDFIVSKKSSIYLESNNNLNNDGAVGTKPQLLLTRISKLYLISRNIIRKILMKINYSKMIYSLDSLLREQIETCNYLRKLEIDRTQERSKQISQAKQILSQKRKSLSGLFKILSKLGINFKSGLMELTLMLETNATEQEKTTTYEFVDYEIKPFDIKAMFIESKYHSKKFDKTFQYLYEDLNSYHGKCIFKLKLLQNQMLTPKSELGLQNIERIKGCSIDMFILIQNQRRTLSRLSKELYDLKSLLNEINALQTCVTQSNFENDHLNFTKINFRLIKLKQRFYKISYVLEQFNLLLESVPDKQNSNDIKNHVFKKKNEEMLFTKCDEKFQLICTEVDRLLKVVHSNLSELLKLGDQTFLSFEEINKFEKLELNIVEKIKKLKNKFKINNNENDYLPIIKPLTDLIKYLNQDMNDESTLCNQIEFKNCENIDNELENVVHSMLMALQKLYKKYDTNKNKNKENDEEFNEIHENHLKQKITNELESDLKILNYSNIYHKIRNIILTLKYVEDIENKSDHVKKLIKILPLFEQYCALGDYYLLQQLGSYKISSKMLSIMLTVFIELNSKGFCIPPDLVQNVEEEKEKSKENEQKGSEGFGLEDGTGENDVSDKIESEDQLDDAKRPEDHKNDDTQDKSNEDCKEEKGIEMDQDFDGKMEDIEKPDDHNDNESDKNDEEEDLDKEMDKTEEGAEKLDDQIWGSDEENENSDSDNESEINEEEDGKGCKDEGDQHNDLDTKKDTKKGEDNKDDGLNATNENERKKQKNDIDNVQEPELDEDQINPYHNELEDPPEPEDMDLSDNFNIDEENKDQDDETDKNDNPFDIDTMKEKVEISKNEDQDNHRNQKDDSVVENDMSDSESESETGTKSKSNEENRENADKDEEKTEKNDDEKQNEVTNETDEVMNENEKESKENKKWENDENEYNESKDNPIKDDNTQAILNEKQKGSLDQVQTSDKMDIEQDDGINEQDTGEEKEGVGRAENDTSKTGHQGITDTKRTQVDKSHQEKINNKEKRKHGKTEEERTLGDVNKSQAKQLKTIEKLKEQRKNEENENNESEMDIDEYQHVREPKKTDKLTLDNATEEQSKQTQHLDDEKENENQSEENDEIADQLESDNQEVEENIKIEIENVTSEKMEKKSEKPSKLENTNEKCETTEQIKIEGDTIETSIVFRGDETSAHFNKDITMDQDHSTELSAAEVLELRKMYQAQVFQQKSILPHSRDFDTWHLISNKMFSNARELCEQLRLILEPTKCTRLKGDYRTGRRINMKKIIPYIASQFRKDKIWLRRTKPAKRDYKITIAIDDSKSMHHNNSKSLTLEAISLVSQALTLLESGKLSIVSFGESPNIILNHTEQFDGPKLVTSLNFSQNQSRIAELLDFIRTTNVEEGSSTSNELFENLLLILSDGRNIYSEGEQKVKNSIKLARLQRIFLVYIIIDNPENKHSILDVRIPEFSSDRKSITMKSYLDVFPFPYYVIVRDLNQLPLVLSEAMRQWFELVNSEQ